LSLVLEKTLERMYLPSIWDLEALPEAERSSSAEEDARPNLAVLKELSAGA
jgi:hypothetical protein